MPPPPLCPKCSAPPGDPPAAPKPLVLGIAWIVVGVAVASHFSLSQPKWAERAAVAAGLGVLPVLFFVFRVRRRASHFACLRCRHEWPRRR